MGDIDEIQQPEKSTICQDTVRKLAEKQNIVATTEPGVQDTERQEKIDKLKKEFNTVAKGICIAQKAIIKAKYKAKRAEISASLPIKKEQFKKERFESTDETMYEKSELRMTFSQIMDELMQGDDNWDQKVKEEREKLNEEEEKKELAQNESEAAKKLDESQKKFEEKQKEIEEKLNNKNVIDINEIIAQTAGSYDKEIDKEADECYKNLNAHLEKINQKAKTYGDKKGAELVKKYNEKLRKQAKKQFEKNKDNLAKAQAVSNEAKQSAILKIGALLGL